MEPAKPETRHRRLARWIARVAIGAVCLVAILWLASPWILSRIAGAWSRAPGDLATLAGAEALALVERAYDGLDADRLLDVHTHVAGLGRTGSGCAVGAAMQSPWHPIQHLQFNVYLHASGVTEMEHADEQYVERLVDLARNARGTFGLMAFDRPYSEQGEPLDELMTFYVPNDYIWRLCEEYPDVFLPIASVHPYRPDAAAELERCAERGARFVKWLPSAMGIDPASERCDPFYEVMRQNSMVLLSHAGDEKAVHAAELQKLGNPLRLRRPLDAGVQVIVAHCGGLGDGEDLDSPGSPAVPNFDLFLRLMDEERYEGLLFGEVSAMTIFNRVGPVLSAILERQDLHARLVNGSDYPLPAINSLMHTGSLAKKGFITDEEADALNEIYDYNPLVFDLVLKRVLRAPGTSHGFSAEVFYTKW